MAWYRYVGTRRATTDAFTKYPSMQDANPAFWSMASKLHNWPALCRRFAHRSRLACSYFGRLLRKYIASCVGMQQPSVHIVILLALEPVAVGVAVHTNEVASAHLHTCAKEVLDSQHL
eukprot:COSAG02_NODE_1691_length_11296_cov_7.891757_4_plen_118_part_00